MMCRMVSARLGWPKLLVAGAQRYSQRCQSWSTRARRSRAAGHEGYAHRGPTEPGRLEGTGREAGPDIPRATAYTRCRSAIASTPSGRGGVD